MSTTEVMAAPHRTVSAPKRPTPAHTSRLRGVRTRYIVRKLVSASAMIIAAITLAFVSMHLAPGDPVSVVTGDASNPELRATIEADWGLDKPLIAQYWAYLTNVLHGDFGRSYVRGEDVSEILFGTRLSATAQLAGAALIFALLIALALAMTTAGRAGFVPKLVQTSELTLASMPYFWLGLILISVFAFNLRVLPVTAGNEIQRLIMPAFTLALPTAAVLSQVLREGMERSLEQPYSLTARARGIGPARLKSRHALRHSLIPATTLAGWIVSGLLTGTVVVEEVFGRPGIGRATVEAVMYQDIPVVLGVAILSSAVYIVVTVLVDISYLWIDPRLKDRVR